MASTIHISVTQDDIEEGHKYCNNSCPVALASKRAANSHQVFVEISTMEIDGVEYLLPVEARDFVACFIGGWPVSPIEFNAVPV